MLGAGLQNGAPGTGSQEEEALLAPGRGFALVLHFKKADLFSETHSPITIVG